MNKEIEITIHHGRNKTETYNISIVPNRFNVDFIEYCQNEAKVKSLSEKLKLAKTDEEKEKINIELKVMNLDDVLKSRYDLIATILYANDYIDNKSDFDYSFWDNKVSYEDVDNFIMQCFTKDKDINDLKKKLQDLR